MRRTEIKEMGTLTHLVEGQAATVWLLVPLAGTLGPSAGPPEQVKGSELGCLR